VAASASVDVVVSAGDFTTRGEGLLDTLRLLREVAVPMVFVAGNHDDLDALREAYAGHADMHVLHGESVIMGDVPFFGLGFEVPARGSEPWNRGLHENEAAELLRPCPLGAVLVTHSPPFGVADVQRTGNHEGSEAVLAAQPRLHLCGHVHHAWGTSGLLGACKIHNLGPRLRRF